VLAALFFVTSLSLAYLGTRTPGEPNSVLERAVLAAPPTPVAPPASAPAPAAPAPAPK